MAAVTMFNPKSQLTQRASAEAYERVWRDEGWVLVDDDPPHDPPDEPDAIVVPDGMSVTTTLEWVGNDMERAYAALAVETAPDGMQRSTAVARLEAVIAEAEASNS